MPTLEIIFAIILVIGLYWAFSRQLHLRWSLRLEFLVLLVLLLASAVYIIVKRFESGLGAVSNMNDVFPWGIWITFDLCGVALAAGGFVLAGTIHIFHLKRYEPVLRPVVLTALIAYTLVAAILVLDLGRPYRFWHPLILWQPHSVMFEITFCLTLYTLVLLFELSPVVFERLRWSRAALFAHRMALPAVILGVILSTLHQSSFGSLFLIIPTKLSVLWYSPWLPVFFLLSAVCAGLAVVMLESLCCERWLKVGLPRDLLLGLGRTCGWILALYAVLRFADFSYRQGWAALGDVPWLGAAWGVELFLGVCLPAVWLLRLKPGQDFGLWAAPLLAAGGVVLNRMNVSWFGLIPGTGYAYVPTLMETALTLAFIVIGVLVFIALAQILPIFPKREREEQSD